MLVHSVANLNQHNQVTSPEPENRNTFENGTKIPKWYLKTAQQNKNLLNSLPNILKITSERSKLKLTTTYLRSIMAQERVLGLAILNIENKVT